MKIRIYLLPFHIIAVALLLAFCGPSPVFAVSTISATPGSDGVFLLQGVGIEDAAALEVTVQYDSATLANPRVVEGPFIAGSMTAINQNIPGTVRIVAIRLTPVRGNGMIATMTFDLKGSSRGKITSMMAKLANTRGATLPVLVQINNPAEERNANPPQNQEPASRTAPVAQLPAPPTINAWPSEKLAEVKGSPALPGAGTLDDRSEAKEPIGELRQEPKQMVRQAESASAAGDTAVRAMAAKGEIYVQKSVLDRFREYRGDRTADAFVYLFNQENMIGCRQDPPVAISDGKAVVIVTFIAPPGKLTSSDVAVTGAQVLSLSKDPDNTNTWSAKLMPIDGGSQASIAVLHGELKMIYPLTIAPKIDRGVSQTGLRTNADFNRYLAEQKTTKRSSPDLNSDGKWDYQDDYILTANYLFMSRKTELARSEAPAAQAQLK